MEDREISYFFRWFLHGDRSVRGSRQSKKAPLGYYCSKCYLSNVSPDHVLHAHDDVPARQRYENDLRRWKKLSPWVQMRSGKWHYRYRPDDAENIFTSDMEAETL